MGFSRIGTSSIIRRQTDGDQALTAKKDYAIVILLSGDSLAPWGPDQGFFLQSLGAGE